MLPVGGSLRAEMVERSRTSNLYDSGKCLHYGAHHLLSRTAGEDLQVLYSIMNGDLQTRNRSPQEMVAFPRSTHLRLGGYKDIDRRPTLVIMCSQK